MLDKCRYRFTLRICKTYCISTAKTVTRTFVNIMFIPSGTYSIVTSGIKMVNVAATCSCWHCLKYVLFCFVLICLVGLLVGFVFVIIIITITTTTTNDSCWALRDGAGMSRQTSAEQHEVGAADWPGSGLNAMGKNWS